DLCDELGLCVWNEGIGWQHTTEHLSDARFIEAQLAHLREMVAMSRNHPSVILWGALNEGHSQEEAARPGYERLLGELRALDNTRPVTFASMFGHSDRCFDLADVVSVNTYPGWYQHELEDIPLELERLLAHLERTQPEKPVIISEIGAAAVLGCHELGGGRWTEEYQARLLEAVIAKLFEQDRVAGLAIWQYCDTRTTDRLSTVLGKPRGYNNKGLLDEYRRPKLAYGAVRRAFHLLKKRT
ncbi:MAG TPA: glycoside hydrolase family 2 TIM barrel-domain containing protein, partial [Polyangiaceae bacterium]